MLEETRIKGIAISAGREAINALIETQTILQLMVKKGLVTPEEVALTRGIVKSQPKYKQMLQALDDAMSRVNESVQFEELLHKMNSGQLTEEERNILLKELDKISRQ